MFPCIVNCKDQFSAVSAGGLKQHQGKCRAFLDHEAAANKRRKATAALRKVRRTNLKERKQRLGSATLGVSFASGNNQS
jgi:hypothetical protein